MATIEEIIVRIGADISDFSRKLQNTSKEISSFGDRAQRLGRDMATSFGGASIAIGGALAYTVKTAADFDTAMRRAGAIAGATSEEFELMKQAALDVGASTSLSASQAAAAMTELSAMGFTAREAIAALPATVSAAEASGEDLIVVTETMAAALNAFGLEAAESGRVADILAQSANDSAAGVLDLQYAFKYAAPVAKQLGVSIEELAASTGIMVDAGLAGEQAGTTLRAAMLRLIDPPKRAANTLEALGIQVQDQNKNFVGLSSIIGQLRESTEGMSDAQRAAAISAIFGTEAVSGMLTLMDKGPETIDAMTESLENSEGASAAAAAEMKAGIGGALENLSGAFETLSITIGDRLVPYVQQAAEWLTELADKFTKLPESTMDFIVKGAAVTAIVLGIVGALGILLGIVGAAASGIAAIGSAFGAVFGWFGKFMKAAKGTAETVGWLTRVTGFLSRAMVFLAGPVGIVIGILTVVGTVLTSLWKKHEGFRNQVTEMWGQLVGVFQRAGAAIMETFGPAFAEISAALGPLREAFGGFMHEVGVIGSILFKSFGDAVTTQLKILQGIFEFVFPYVEQIVKAVWFNISQAVKIGTDTIVGILEALTLLLQGDFAGAWRKWVDTIDEHMARMGHLVSNGIERVKKVVKDTITSMIADVLARFVQWRNDVGNAFDAMGNVIFRKIASWAAPMLSAGAQRIQDFISGILGKLGTVGNAMQNIKDTVINRIKNIDLVGIGADAIAGLIRGIRSKIADIGSAAAEAAAKIPKGIAGLLDMRSPSRLLEGQGDDAIQGLINGILGMKNQLVRAAQLAAEWATPHLEELQPAGIGPMDYGTITASMEPDMARLDADMEENGGQAAQIRLRLGGTEYETFVDDITDTQDRKEYRLKIFKG